LKSNQKYAVLVIFFIILVSTNIEAQCAMCKQAAESSLKNDPSSMVRSLNSGILYLMAVPYLMIMFIFRKQLYQLWKKFTNRTKKQESRAEIKIKD
jgi:hypothetical protein